MPDIYCVGKKTSWIFLHFCLQSYCWCILYHLFGSI